MYHPDPLNDNSDLGRYLSKELEKIADAFRIMQIENLEFKVWNVAPDKPRQGVLYYADGTNWNPGGGEGLYRHTGSAWVKVG